MCFLPGHAANETKEEAYAEGGNQRSFVYTLDGALKQERTYAPKEQQGEVG